MPTTDEIVWVFIEGLNGRFIDFKLTYVNKILPYPDSLAGAVSGHHTYKSLASQDAAPGQTVMVTQHRDEKSKQ